MGGPERAGRCIEGPFFWPHYSLYPLGDSIRGILEAGTVSPGLATVSPISTLF
jgi:hypothetical protein